MMSSQAEARTFIIAWILSHTLTAADSAVSPRNCMQPCMIDRSCPSLLEKIPALCGPTDNQHCFSRHQSECRESLVRLKSTPELQSSCHCQNPSSRSCQDYYNLLYNHPCLRHPAVPIYPQSAQPYNFDLEFAGQLLMSKHILLSCPSALHACRKSPLCRRVYDEFRRRCKIKENRCRMTNAALCYNSYELIKLTPLWRCICDKPSEKRCLRIQKSIVGNPCIGGMPHLYDTGDDDDDNLNTTHLGAGVPGTSPPVIRRTTPVRIWPPPRPAAATTPATSRHRLTAPPRTRPVIPATTAEAPTIEDVDEETAVPPLPAEETTSEEPPEAAELTEIFPGPDEEFDLVPHIAAALMYPISYTIKGILVEHYGMVTEPPPTTTTTTTETPADGEDVSEPTAGQTDSEETETGEGVSKQLLTGRSTTQAPPSGRSLSTAAGRGRTAASMRTTTTAITASPGVAGQTSVGLQTSTRSFRRRTTVTLPLGTAETRTSSSILPIMIATTPIPVTTTDQTLLIDSTSSEDGEDYSSDYPTSHSTDYSTTTESAETETTTIIIDYSIQNPTVLPSGMCWKHIDNSRENPEFDLAVEKFHTACRWTTDANDTCDATSCLDAEARLQRWMGDLFLYCRNLTCDNSLPQCADLIDFLTPGCVKDAFFLEDGETETVTCRDIKRNGLVLTVPRYKYKRIFKSDDGYCSDLCTCDADGKVKCDPLPCLESKVCKGGYAEFPPGAPSYKAFQGPCQCHMNKMLCVRPYNYTISKGVWLFMAYSTEEEEMLFSKTNLTIDNDIVTRMRQLPYALKREEPCLFHLEPSEPDYVILRSDEFEFDNTTAETGSEGTRINEEYCDKFFRWIVNEVNGGKSTRQDLLLSIVRLAEVEWDKRVVSSAVNLGGNLFRSFAIINCLVVLITFSPGGKYS